MNIPMIKRKFFNASIGVSRLINHSRLLRLIENGGYRDMGEIILKATEKPSLSIILKFPFKKMQQYFEDNQTKKTAVKLNNHENLIWAVV